MTASLHAWLPRRLVQTATAVAVAMPGLVVTTAAAAVAAPIEVRVPASVDTYVVQEQPNMSHGSETKLTAANWSDPWHTTTYLRFAVPAAPTGQRVTGVRLELTFQKLTLQPSTLELRTVSGTGWSESITYANRPAAGAVVATASIAAQGATSVSFDLTSVVNATSGEYSFAVTNPTSQSAGVFNSREYGANPPSVVLSYDSATPTLCGASFFWEGTESWPQALAREDSLFGGLDSVRFFHSGRPPAWPGPLDAGPRAFIVSFKGHPRDYVAGGASEEHMRQWFASAPRDRDIYWVYYHEPEQEIRDGQFTAAEYRAALKHLAELAGAAGNPRLFATEILMQWTVDPRSGRNWRDYYPGDGVLDVLGWDIYNDDAVAAKGQYTSPATLLEGIFAANDSVRLPTGIGELGSHIAAGDDGTRRAVWLQEMVNRLEAYGTLWVEYFDVAWTSGDYRLRDPDSASVWRTFCS
jgi:hypothetical protein